MGRSSVSMLVLPVIGDGHLSQPVTSSVAAGSAQLQLSWQLSWKFAEPNQLPYSLSLTWLWFTSRLPSQLSRQPWIRQRHKLRVSFTTLFAAPFSIYSYNFRQSVGR